MIAHGAGCQIDLRSANTLYVMCCGLLPSGYHHKVDLLAPRQITIDINRTIGLCWKWPTYVPHQETHDTDLIYLNLHAGTVPAN